VGHALAQLVGVGMFHRQAVPLCWLEQSRGGARREREGGRKGPGFKLNFFKILNRNLKNFDHKSCREFENLRLLFWIKVYLSFSLEVILYLRLLGFEFLFISCV
jgi:hypothetical protein